MTEFRLGEKVRATFEGEVSLGTTPGDPYVRLEMPGDRQAFAWLPKAVVEPENAEFEVFKPGDIVQSKGLPDAYRYLVTHDGYVQLSDGRHYAKDAAYMETYFNSKEMNKVNLVEVPF